MASVCYSNKQRIDFIDLAKGFCILLVVFRHVSASMHVEIPCEDALTIFRIPLYFFLSGLFFKEYNGFFNFVLRKTNKLLIPFTFFFLMTSIILLNIQIAMNVPYVNYYKENGFIGINSFMTLYNERFYNMPIWFLLCLFYVNILFYILFIITKHIKHKIYVLCSVSFILGLLGFVLGHKGINIPLYIDTAFTCIPFFCCGYVFRKYTNILYPNKYDRYIPLYLLLSAVYVLLFCCKLDYYNNMMMEASFFSTYTCGIVGTLFIIYLSKFLHKLPGISYFGRYSIIILCTHVIVMRLPIFIFKRIINDAWLQTISVFVTLMCLYFAIIPFMKSFFPYVIAQKDLIRVNEENKC